MRGKRSKQYRKLMHAYALAFNFREPYQVLLDADFIQDAQRCKMNLGSMLEHTLHGGIKPMITQCCIRHLYKAQPDAGLKAQKEQWIEVAKQAERRRCGHHELEEPLSALECITSVVDPKNSGSNKHRYVVAAQDKSVREAMRQIAGVPLIYINRSVMILEPLAAKTEQVRNAEEISKRKAGLRSRVTPVVGEKRKRGSDEDVYEGEDTVERQEQTGAKRKKLRGPKGPNPLSVKKPQKSADTAVQRRPRSDQTSKPSVQHPEDKQHTIRDDGTDPSHRKRKRKRKLVADGAGVVT